VSPRAASYIFAFEDFDEPRAASPEPDPTPDPLPALLAAARDEGFRAGQAAGAEAMRKSLETATLSSLDALAAALGRDAERRRAEAEAQAAEVARAAVAALLATFPTLGVRIGEEEALRFAEALLPSLVGEGALRLHVAPVLRDPIAARLAGAAGVDILADEALEPGDATISWQGGASERRTADAIAAVTALLAEQGLA
jgi:flagellar assembly protein FliH